MVAALSDRSQAMGLSIPITECTPPIVVEIYPFVNCCNEFCFCRESVAVIVFVFERRPQRFRAAVVPDPSGAHRSAQTGISAASWAIARAVYWVPRSELSRIRLYCDRISTYTATTFTAICRKLGVAQSMGRVGSCFGNAAAEAFFSTLEHEVLSRHHFTTKAQARHVVVAWCQDCYNTRRRHSSAKLMSPITIRETCRGPTGRGIRMPPRFQGKPNPEIETRRPVAPSPRRQTTSPGIHRHPPTRRLTT